MRQNLITWGQSAQDESGQDGKTTVSASSAQTDAQLLDELFAVQQKNLQFTKIHSGKALRCSGELQVSAHQVHAAGFRASYPLAFQLVYVYRLFRLSVYLMNGQAGGLEMQLRTLKADDAVVVASFTPYFRETETVAQTVWARGCKVVAITDSVASPLSVMADETLLFSVAQAPRFSPPSPRV